MEDFDFNKLGGYICCEKVKVSWGEGNPQDATESIQRALSWDVTLFGRNVRNKNRFNACVCVCVFVGKLY
jgi:hypothetical protein